MFDLGSKQISQSRRAFLQRCAVGSVSLAAAGVARGEPATSGVKQRAGDTYETEAVGIRIVPGAWRPHYAWEHIAWVSPPWPSQDYIWLDFPEAIFTSQGLLYLSHINPPIPTVFHDLPRVAWQAIPDGISYERTLPNGVAFGGNVSRADESTVDLELHLSNGSKDDLKNITLQTCAFLRAIKEFADYTQANKFVHVPNAGWIPLADASHRDGGKEKYRVGWRRSGKPVADLPVAVTVSNMAERLVAMTWFDDTLSMVGNPQHPCFHADPRFPDLKPGERASIRGKLIFFDGPLARFDLGKYGPI